MNKKYYIVNNKSFNYFTLPSFTTQYYTWYNIFVVNILIYKGVTIDLVFRNIERKYLWKKN